MVTINNSKEFVPLLVDFDLPSFFDPRATPPIILLELSGKSPTWSSLSEKELGWGSLGNGRRGPSELLLVSGSGSTSPL